jgi:hypothetical protein
MMTHPELQTIDQPIYDTLHTLAPRLHSRRWRDVESMFVIPFGMMHETKVGLRVKTWEDTNMLQSGQLDMPKSMLIKNIRCVLLGRRLFSIDSRYYHDLWINFVICGKTMWTGPAWRCADPVTMMLNQTALMAMDASDRTELISVLRRPLDPPIEIRQQESFHVQVVFGNSWKEAYYAAPEKLMILLEGQIKLAYI